MTREERAAIYEKLYFHELERREKINARLAVPLAATLAVAGLLSFMLNAADQPHGLVAVWLFRCLFVASAAALTCGAWFFRKAWFGHTDKLLPTADAIEAYHQQLEATYKEFDDSAALVEKHFRDFLFDYYKRDSSANAVNNDQRSYNLYRANAALTISALLALAAAAPFYWARTPAVPDLEESHAMHDPKAPPPPPPPPPERLVKGDVPKLPPPPPRERR